jgi:hypothetical protein
VFARGEDVTQFFFVYLMTREAVLLHWDIVDNAATLEWTRLLQASFLVLYTQKLVKYQGNILVLTNFELGQNCLCVFLTF